MKPYIGICDFVHFEEVKRMFNVFAELERVRPKECRERKLAVGAMMSYETLNGFPTEWAKIWPKREDYVKLFHCNMYPLNCLHYADYENGTKADDLLRATELCGPYLNALQLDMSWPDPQMLREFFYRRGRKTSGYLKIVLRVSGPTIDLAGGTPGAVIARLKEYSGLVNCTLLDLGMRMGIQLAPATLRSYIVEIKAHLPRMNVAIAGGLGPDLLAVAEALIAEFPELSIDAQSRLRSSGDVADPIDWDLAEQYLGRSTELFRKHELAKK